MGTIRCLRSNSADSVYSYVGNHDREDKPQRQFYRSWEKWQKVLFIIGVILFVILFLAFLAIWVIFPLVYMNSISVQRFFLFYTFQIPKNPEFDNPQKYGIDGVVNFYITTKNTDNSSLVSIGSWLIVPESQINSSSIKLHNKETAANLISTTTYPIIIYTHGVGCNRILPMETYKVLRKSFMIVAHDPRGYGDSGSGLPPSELGIVSDMSQIFKWIRFQTKNDIYIWGHSLGTALSTHTVRTLNEEYNIVPSGLILESAFTTMREEIPATSIGQLFSWMPWFEATVQTPLEKNGFLFRTTTNIIYVDCPIMILHAEDDEVIPYRFGRKVAEVASTKRAIPPKGNVTYHEFGRLGYGHIGITTDPNILQYINEFVGFCKDQNKRRG